MTWQWLRDNWSWIEESFGSDKSYDAFPRYAGSVLMTAQELKEYKEFFSPLRSRVLEFISDGAKKRLPIELVRQADFVENVRVIPEKVEYFLIKK